MHVWQLQDAKARFSEVVKLCLSEGPQGITLRGHEAVVLVPTAEWRRLLESEASMADPLLSDFPKFEFEGKGRRGVRSRPVDFSD